MLWAILFFYPCGQLCPQGQALPAPFRGEFMDATYAAFNLYEILVEFNVPADRAHALNEAYNRVQEQSRKEVLDMVEKSFQSKTDAGEVESRLESAISSVKTDLERSIKETRVDLEKSIQSVRMDLEKSIQGVKVDLSKSILDVQRSINDQTWKLVTFSVVINGAMLGIFKLLMN